MLIAGILLGPYVLNLLDPSVINMSGDLRKIALIIIIAKAGLSLDVTDLIRIGRPAVMLCFVPATFELLAFILFAPSIMGVTVLQAAIGGVPMALGLGCGNIVLTMAVISIVITAPLGALGMDATVHKYITKDSL